MRSPRTTSGEQPVGPDSEIPDKLYFKIGEVAQLVGVQTHVLRYWEKEIPFIRPGKTVSNQRRYRRKDVEVFREIRRLLHQERYTLAGARKRLMSKDKDRAEPNAEASFQVVTDASSEDAASTAADKDVAAHHELGQLPLGFAHATDTEKLERIRSGLRELIRLAGEEP